MDPRVAKMAAVIVQYSLAVQPGEQVLLRGTSPLAQPLLRAMTEATLRAGGDPVTYIHPSGEGVSVLEHGSEAQIEKSNPLLMLAYETFDKIVRVEAEEETGVLAGYPAAKQQAWGRRSHAPITVQFRREAAKELRRCTTLFPTPAYAKDAGMSLDAYEDFVFGACMTHLEDPVTHWRQVSAMQQRLCDYLRGKKVLQVRGKNIDLEMSIDGRLFENADGLANMPDGEIFTGPVEDSVNGWVRFTYPAIYQGNKVMGIELRFKNGVITEATADENEEFLLATLDTDAGARRLGEFAIGTNTSVNRFTGQILFDEKIHGTVHMAVGAAYPSTGGTNQSNVHWDMICDMMSGGEILVDGVRFYENGTFLV